MTHFKHEGEYVLCDLTVHTIARTGGAVYFMTSVVTFILNHSIITLLFLKMFFLITYLVETQYNQNIIRSLQFRRAPGAND